jgi:hypothetical protein
MFLLTPCCSGLNLLNMTKRLKGRGYSRDLGVETTERKSYSRDLGVEGRTIYNK